MMYLYLILNIVVLVDVANEAALMQEKCQTQSDSFTILYYYNIYVFADLDTCLAAVARSIDATGLMVLIETLQRKIKDKPPTEL